MRRGAPPRAKASGVFRSSGQVRAVVMMVVVVGLLDDDLAVVVMVAALDDDLGVVVVMVVLRQLNTAVGLLHARRVIGDQQFRRVTDRGKQLGIRRRRR